jgi:hypothetical protein
MPTIWDPHAREEILARFARLTPECQAVWGKMNAGQMVRHCGVALDMLVGAAKVTPKPGPFRNPVLRYLIVHWLPWPKGAPTGAELIMTDYVGDWERDMAALRKSLEAVVARGEGGSFVEHPAFGALPGKSVGVLVWRHLDHHLRQFGMG